MAASPLPIDTDPLAPSDPAADAIHTAPLSDPAPLPDTRPMSPPAPWLLGPPRMLTAPPMSVDFAVPASSVSSEPASLTVTRAPTITAMPPAESDAAARHCSRTLHRCQHSWKLRWTQTHHRCCRPAPRQMPTPFELHRSCCQCRQLLKTESVIHPVSRSRVKGGNRGVSWSFSYRWQHVHWAPVAPHRKR